MRLISLRDIHHRSRRGRQTDHITDGATVRIVRRLRIVVIRPPISRLAMRVERTVTGRLRSLFRFGSRGTRDAGIKDLMLQVVQ